ncbi:MAG TPA: hypothetical protein PLE35_04035 [Lentisphaeria bacterium]|nr:hypothetical protein [Lentisphaeria bacterium]
MSPDEAYRELAQQLRRLERLNPDLTATEVERLNLLAEQSGQQFFGLAAEQVERLVTLYRTCAVKISGENILAEYFECIENSSRLLAQGGEISQPEPAPTTFSKALVPAQTLTALDRCMVLSRAVVPHALGKAADAFRRRNEVVETVLELAFRVLWRMDADRACQWFLDFFARHDGQLDPDVIRDALTVVLEAPGPIPRDFLAWAERWSADPNLLEYWPNVTRKADRLLCRHGMRAWRDSAPARIAPLAHLRLLVDQRRLDDTQLLSWLRKALNDLGESVLRFMALDESLATSQKDWKTAALVGELRRMTALYPVVMLAADLILTLPDGSEKLALAFMGLAGQGREQWDQRVEQFAVRVIRRMFITDMRDGRKPLATIQRLTFGDLVAFKRACAELDIVQEQFDSIKQRERVIAILASFYASYRHASFLATEVSRRYRSLMRLLHEDYLRQHLPAEELDGILRRGVITELAGMASAARRYLARRRDFASSLEEMLAAKMDFELHVRTQRLAVFRQIMPG